MDMVWAIFMKNDNRHKLNSVKDSQPSKIDPLEKETMQKYLFTKRN